MIWHELIQQASILFTNLLGISIDTTWAGILVSFIFISSILLGVYILTRGTVSNSKTWITVALFISITLFTYPIEWIPIWIGMISMILPISGYIGWKISKVARSQEG